MINVQVDGHTIIKKKDINIGMAAALPSGNLIVPVIKNADRLNLTGLAAAVNDLANRARAGKLNPDEIGSGTYTITNVGTFGNVLGTPIINQPQVAILGVGAVEKRPVVIDDAIAIRSMCYMALSFDHRLIDGAIADLTPVIPTTRRTFGTTERVSAFVRVYQKDDRYLPTATVSLVNAVGHPIFETSAPLARPSPCCSRSLGRATKESCWPCGSNSLC